MGVSGSGKTTTGENLAARLGWRFSDADAFHSAANKEKMAHGIALDDNDRRPWLEAMHAAMAAAEAAGEDHVFACSALKGAYRDVLRGDSRAVSFVMLALDAAALADRLSKRRGHFFDPALLRSQLETLEAPAADEALTVDATHTPEQIVDEIVDWLRRDGRLAA
ncbi:gluconokinase [Chitinasiproducens palmae]|nr:gluconokinase [Chitinasiproducens palmae]